MLYAHWRLSRRIRVSKDREPRVWEQHMEHPQEGTDRSNGSSGGRWEVELACKKRAYIRRRLGPATWQVAQKIAGFSLAQILYMPQNGVQWYLYPFAKHTQIDALRQAGNGVGILDSTSPGIILLLGFEQISHLVSTMEFVPRAWSRHNSGRQHV